MLKMQKGRAMMHLRDNSKRCEMGSKELSVLRVARIISRRLITKISSR
jgi:hypothetical protein